MVAFFIGVAVSIGSLVGAAITIMILTYVALFFLKIINKKRFTSFADKHSDRPPCDWFYMAPRQTEGLIPICIVIAVITFFGYVYIAFQSLSLGHAIIATVFLLLGSVGGVGIGNEIKDSADGPGYRPGKPSNTTSSHFVYGPRR